MRYLVGKNVIAFGDWLSSVSYKVVRLGNKVYMPPRHER